MICLISNCSQISNRNVASHKILDQNGLELAKEVIPADEEESTKQIISLIGEGYAHYNPKDLKPAAHRIIHGKEHGCVEATFKVKENIPKDLQYGIFSKLGTSFQSWIRFSNGSGRPQHDGMPDARGLAIKLVNLENEEVQSQDFLLQSSPIFFVSNVKEYIKFMKFNAHPGPAGIGELLSSSNLSNPKEQSNLKALLLDSAALIESPLRAKYYSALPQALGPYAMKLHARACNSKGAGPKNNLLSSNFLGEALKKELAAKPGCMELLVQVQNDAVKMPIEDAMVKWDEQISPFIPVATITIPNQNFQTKERKTFCENISFNPWNTISDHQPLGGLNRVRRVVYEESSKLRHHLNNTEPSKTERNED
jgi:hypothetical protein